MTVVEDKYILEINYTDGHTEILFNLSEDVVNKKEQELFKENNITLWDNVKSYTVYLRVHTHGKED